MATVAGGREGAGGGGSGSDNNKPWRIARSDIIIMDVEVTMGQRPVVLARRVGYTRATQRNGGHDPEWG